MNTKPIYLTQEETEWLEEVLPNIPYEPEIDGDHPSNIENKLYKLKQEFWNE